MGTTHTGLQAIESENLYTVSAGGFSATADAFARDPDSGELWFLSMVGSQTALKAIWASLLKQPPEAAHLIRGADGGELTGNYLRCSVPRHTIGTWTTKIARLPTTGGWHAMVYTRMAEFSFEREDFLLLARYEEDARTSTTGSWTGAAPCPSTVHGRLGSGEGASEPGRSSPSSRRGSPDTSAPPTGRY